MSPSLVTLLGPLAPVLGMLGAPAIKAQERGQSEVLEVQSQAPGAAKEAGEGSEDDAVIFDLGGLSPRETNAPSSGVGEASATGVGVSDAEKSEDASALSTAPPMPVVEDLNAERGAQASGDTPVGTTATKPPRGRGSIVLGGGASADPIGGGGAGFFDPGRLGGDSPAGGALQIRGYLGVNFVASQRTNRGARDPETGAFEQLPTLPYFGGGAANIYVGAPIYSDVVYARFAFEFLSVPRAGVGSADVSPVWSPVVLMESAALEVNPFAWAEKSGRWLREGFKITAGVFVVPFGLEDEEHDAPVRWFVSRPLAMSVGRVYPGSWIDIGATVKWKPTFGRERPVRPLEIDVGLINGDACTQTRSADLLYRYQPIGQVDEVCERRLREVEEIARADGSVLGITPDNNGNKSVIARVQVRPIPALNVGGSVVWGKHPESTFTVTDFQSKTFVDSRQAATWRAGAHFDLNLDEVLQSRFPLPHIRAELVYGVDRAAAGVDPSMSILADRQMLGGYVQIAQPLWRRKKTRLSGVILQYRFDHADPDLAVPRVADGGGAVNSDFSDPYLYDEAFQAHVIGLRFPVLPRFTLKTEYGILREDGGPKNQLFNDFFMFQAVADF